MEKPNKSRSLCHKYARLIECLLIIFVYCRVGPILRLPWRHLPARYAIFVAQLGRKFRPFSLTMQRYEILIAVYESFAKNFRFFFLMF